LLYDTGTSKYIDNVISGDATLADTGALTIAADAITGAKIADNAINSEHYTDGSIDTAHIADAQITAAKLAADAISTPLRPNVPPLIINGDMAVAQRATSASNISTTGYHAVDRMKFTASDGGTFTISQDNDVPSGYGFSKSLKFDVTTAKDTPVSGSISLFDYRPEAQDLRLLGYGTALAKTITLAFWIKSPKTGTHVVHIYQHDGVRHIAKTYTVSSANTWEKHVITFPGDTGGTINNDAGIGFQIQWGLCAGSSYTSGTLATSWASYSNANSFVGQVNLADSNSNNIFFTGIQLEVGSFTAATIPDFQHESYIKNVERCWRYFEACESEGTNLFGQGFLSDGSGRVATLIGFHPKRAIPTVTSSAAGTFTGSQGVQAGGVATGFIVKAWSISTGANSGVAAGMCHVHLDTSGHSSMTDGQMCRVANTSGTNAFIKCDAEL